MSDEQHRHRIPFAFLSEIQTLFTQKYGLDIPQRAIAFSLNEEFSKVIQDRMDYYNTAGSNVDSISAVKNQIEDVKDVMVQNIEKVLERGEKIELLVDKTDRLNQQAFRFESSSRKLRQAMWWKSVRSMMCWGGGIVFLM
jgi:vesicle-associated membrane protein 7